MAIFVRCSLAIPLSILLSPALPSTLQPSMCRAQDVAPADSKPVVFTTQEDHQNMMQQLGITKLRPGPSGDPTKENSANYDETKANPFPDWPPILTLDNGQPVSSPEVWWKERRPELVELFEREVYGRIPSNVPSVTWQVKETRDETKGGDCGR